MSGDNNHDALTNDNYDSEIHPTEKVVTKVIVQPMFVGARVKALSSLLLQPLVLLWARQRVYTLYRKTT